MNCNAERRHLKTPIMSRKPAAKHKLLYSFMNFQGFATQIGSIL